MKFIDLILIWVEHSAGVVDGNIANGFNCVFQITI